MKKILLLSSIAIIIACSPSIDTQMNIAESKFIEEMSFMTEEKALSQEIDYYKPPQITKKEHVRTLTGKDLIHECNKIIAKDKKSVENSKFIVRTHYVEDVKEYAIQNPEKEIANEFVFSGIFTQYGINKYVQLNASIIFIPHLDRYIIKE